VKPRYWGSWKGLVLKAIASEGARTLRDIQASSELDSESLNQALSELFSINALSKTGDSYWIEDYALYREYKGYVEGNYGSPYLDRSSQERAEKLRVFGEESERISRYIEGNRERAENTIVGFVLGWALRNGIEFNLPSEHFFLEGDLLDRISKDVISYSGRHVVVVNPYVDKCSLSDKLKDACSYGRFDH